MWVKPKTGFQVPIMPLNLNPYKIEATANALQSRLKNIKKKVHFRQAPAKKANGQMDLRLKETAEWKNNFQKMLILAF